jgi:hypothetical protein
VEVPTKLRTMALAAALRSATRRGKPSKVVVFMSSCDGVEFHHLLLGPYFEQASGEKLLQCPLLKLHGDMLQVCASVCVCVCGGGQVPCCAGRSPGLGSPTSCLLHLLHLTAAHAAPVLLALVPACVTPGRAPNPIPHPQHRPPRPPPRHDHLHPCLCARRTAPACPTPTHTQTARRWSAPPPSCSSPRRWGACCCARTWQRAGWTSRRSPPSSSTTRRGRLQSTCTEWGARRASGSRALRCCSCSRRRGCTRRCSSSTASRSPRTRRTCCWAGCRSWRRA